MVNTASRCGFTPQYENLQNLFINYKDTDLTILAITSNSFNQEYSSNEEIKKITEDSMVARKISRKIIYEKVQLIDNFFRKNLKTIYHLFLHCVLVYQ
mgnify:CR=1 FL=1